MSAPDRDPRATALLRELRAEALPAWLPGEPRNVAALHGAERAARALLRMLARKHKVQRWDWPAFRAHFLEGLLASARGAVVEERGLELRITTAQCPLQREAARDPRACTFCQLLPEAAARLAVPGEVREVSYSALITEGRPSCVLRIVRSGGGDGRPFPGAPLCHARRFRRRKPHSPRQDRKPMPMNRRERSC